MNDIDSDSVLCFTCEHCGGLSEALVTEVFIPVKSFVYFLDFGLYHFYCYDDRICADRYIIFDISSCGSLPTWINVYRHGLDKRNKWLSDHVTL